MIVLHHILSFLIFLIIDLPAAIIAVPCLAIMLPTKWDGRTYFFGNSKWGRATNHYLAPTNGNYWKELGWMAWRNKVYNLGAHTLAVKMKDYDVWGDDEIGDKIKGGYYRVQMGKFWEYYWVKPYKLFGLKLCVRWRVGWKIMNNTTGKAECVFSINPVRSYKGI